MARNAAIAIENARLYQLAIDKARKYCRGCLSAASSSAWSWDREQRDLLLRAQSSDRMGMCDLLDTGLPSGRPAIAIASDNNTLLSSAYLVCHSC
jgi:hypothetical protein